MTQRKKRFMVNAKLINTTLDKSKTAVSQGIAFSRLLIIALVLDILVILCVFFLKRFLPPEIPLLFGLAEGQDQLVGSTSLVLPSLVSLVIVLLNTALSLLVSDEYLQKALVTTAFASSIIAIIATMEVFILVGSF